MTELVNVHIVEERQLRQRGPLPHRVPDARRLANRLQDDLGGEGRDIHGLGNDRRDGFICPSHVSGLYSGHRLHPAFGIRRPALRSRPDDGFPVYGKTIAFIYVHSRIGNMFRHTPSQGYSRSALHRHTATRLQDCTPPPGRTGGRVAHGCSQAMLLFLREVPSGPPESRLQLQAFSKSGGTTENPRSETRGPVCIPKDASRNHLKKGTGVRVRGNPCRICVTGKTG